jgi:hypothetical protein
MMAFDSGGVSQVLGTVSVDFTTTFKALRLLIEYKKEGDMLRRTTMFQEVINSCQTAKNYYNLPVDRMTVNDVYSVFFFNPFQRFLLPTN